ncbi:MAG: N-acetylmuramoyl-L-alanine amidase [Pseudomonadales bacterium]|nr:N-acetylmuramoyl-L-alanine amidase [Pseudomonadales bacterium]
MGWRAPGAIVALWLAAFLMPATAATLVQGSRLIPTDAGARLELSFDRLPASHKIFTLDHPDRVVIDLADTKLARALGTVATAGTAVRGIRSGVHQGTGLRIVVDLSGPMTATGTTLAAAGQPMLQIELHNRNRGPAARAATTAIQAPGAGQPVASAPRPPPSPSPPARGAQRDIVIAIDAGHGGQDPGAIGPNGLREKQVVLAISKELKGAIDREPGYRAVLVRTGDYFIPLAQRPAIARRAGADVMLSIHADAFHRVGAHGASVYALSQKRATSETAKYLAERENRSDLIGGSVALHDKDPMLAGVILDLSMTATLNHSLHLGSQVLTAMGSVNKLHKNQVEQAGFVVLKSPDLPSILVETGFISNPQEAGRLADAGHQRRLAGAIFNGVKRHFAVHPPDGTRIAWQRRNGSGRTHVIDRGDTLSTIAEQYDTSVNQLIRHNGLDSAVIRVGQTLKIPGSS